jgi:hypothetical protein
LSAAAALTYSGNVSSGCAWRALSDSGDSTEICTPASRACGTDRSASLPYTLIEGKPPTDFPLFQPASRKTPSNCLSKFIHSSSGQTAENLYSTSLNCLSVAINSGIWISDRGDLMRASSSSALAARASALAARSLACAICNENPSAFFLATSAASNALAARAFSSVASCSALAARSFSWLASRSVWDARSKALAARSLAVPVFFWASVSRVSSNFCMNPSALETKLSATNSPATPTTIRSHPKETTNFTQAGIWRSGECRSALTAFMLSSHISGNSNSSPRTTTPVEISNELKHVFLNASKSALIRSSIPLSTSGANTGGGEIGGKIIDADDQQTEALITLIKFLIVIAVACVIMSLVCIWEFTIGIKKSIKQLYNRVM